MARYIGLVLGSVYLATAALPVYAKSYGASFCHQEGYSCYKVKRGDSWTKTFPDPDRRDAVMRINRTNNALYSGQVIAVPDQLGTINSIDYAPFARTIQPTGSKIIIVSLTKLAFGAYDENGDLIYWGPISGGKNYCPDVGRGCRTATGEFEIYSKEGAGCKSRKFPVGRGGAPMPYCMFFHKGFALHGSYDVPGYNASHGCIRLFVKDAKWLNQEFTAGEHGVPVIVK